MLSILVLFTIPVYADFLDVPQKHWAYPSIVKLLDYEIINYSADFKFHGQDPVNKYQMAAIFNHILKHSGKIKEVEAITLEAFYTDVPEDQYAYQAVVNLVKMGLFEVPESKLFRGDTDLTRYVFFSYLAAFVEQLEGARLPEAAADQGYADIIETHPAYPYIQKLIGAGILSGQGKFNGDKLVTRYQMAVAVARILDYYYLTPEADEEEAEKEIIIGYTDVPKAHYARQAIGELIDAGILPPGKGREFRGDEEINKYYLMYFLCSLIEEMVTNQGEELPEAGPERAYKDVPVNNYAYRSIQKLIALGVIPPGNQRELFNGNRRINRYQMNYFMFSAIENVLSSILTFQPAAADRGYADVPEDNFAYETIQKLIKLGVLPGGKDRDFNGDGLVNRYELSYFTVNMIHGVYVALKDAEVVYRKPVEYGFEVLLSTNFTASQITDGVAPGQDLNNVYAYQSLSLSFNRRLNEILSIFASLYSSYYFGDTTTASDAYIDSAYATLQYRPLALQMGRTSYYQSYSPFGNSLYVDTYSTSHPLDVIITGYYNPLFYMESAFGKIAYLGDLSQDSNYGTVSFTPRFTGFLGMVDLTVAGSLVTDMPDPTFTYTMPTRATQGYGGLKISLFNFLELSAELASVNFTNASAVLPIVGSTTNEGLSAAQYAITYYSEDYGHSISIGYQSIGDDYFMSVITDPTEYLTTLQGADSYLLRGRYYISPTQLLGIDMAYVTMSNNFNRISIETNFDWQMFETTSVNFSIDKIADSPRGTSDELKISSSVSTSF